MRIKETKVYSYDELSDAAKDKARDWYRQANVGDCFFAEHITDEFHEVLKAFGFDVIRGLARNGARRSNVYWSGFSSQGDGASFSGSWRAADFKPDALLANRGDIGESKEATELHRIAAELRTLIACGLESADVGAPSRGFFMTLNSADWGDSEEDEHDDGEEAFITCARDLAHGFYRALEAAYDYQNSDECVAESIIANEYEFTEEGARA